MTIPHALDDHFLLERMRQVVAERGIEVIVETGIAEGNSALKFCSLAPRYYGIDIDPMRVEQTRQTLTQGGATNDWEILLGNSPDVLRLLVPSLTADKTLFFLDAHNFPGNTRWPLPDEVRALPRGQGVMCFHDFHVPGRDFGVDGYTLEDGRHLPFDYDLVRDVLTEWSPTHRLEYMTQASGSYRGAAFVYPS